MARCNRLSWKLLAVLLGAAIAGIVLGLGTRTLGRVLVRQVYCAPKQTAWRLEQVAGEFRRFAVSGSIHSADAVQIGRWNREHPGVTLTVYANGTILTSSGQSVELIGAENGLVIRTPEWEQSETVLFPVTFADGTYQVAFQEESARRLYRAVNLFACGLGGALFLILVLLFSSRTTRHISRLARQVRQVSQGDLSLEIAPPSRDEIGDLAEDVNAMRLAIMEQLRREERAWQANGELITAISHDLRTPLTALLGYLDLLENQALAPEQQRQYLEICRNKAEKLRQMTEQMFSYFLLFGKPEPELRLEEFDAVTLLDQILGEQAADLMSRGYAVDIRRQQKNGVIRVDVAHLCRVFDNLFSNVLKYADPAHLVIIQTEQRDRQLSIRMSNRIRSGTGQVESSKIGLQTCQKLLQAMGGRFRQERSRDSFLVEVILPVEKTEI